jgi:uridylate kinase
MSDQHRERIVVSVGGSLIVPDEVDITFLRALRTLISEKVSAGFSFYIITGGGKLARKWRDAAKEINPDTSTDDLDWIGIAATRVNAELVRAIFADETIPPVILDTRSAVESASPLVFAGGVKTGNSSDWAAVEAARAVGAKKLVNLSNIDYVYTADPRMNPDAQKVENISWADFRKLIPSEWNPGLSSPFDPIAAKEAEAMGLEVAVINGAKLEEFSNYLDGKPFVGTIIK